MEPDNDVMVADLGEKFEEEAELQKSLRTNIHQLDEGLIIIDGGTETVVHLAGSTLLRRIRMEGP